MPFFTVSIGEACPAWPGGLLSDSFQDAIVKTAQKNMIEVVIVYLIGRKEVMLDVVSVLLVNLDNGDTNHLSALELPGLSDLRNDLLSPELKSHGISYQKNSLSAG